MKYRVLISTASFVLHLSIFPSFIFWLLYDAMEITIPHPSAQPRIFMKFGIGIILTSRQAGVRLVEIKPMTAVIY